MGNYLEKHYEGKSFELDPGKEHQPVKVVVKMHKPGRRKVCVIRNPPAVPEKAVGSTKPEDTVLAEIYSPRNDPEFQVGGGCWIAVAREGGRRRMEFLTALLDHIEGLAQLNFRTIQFQRFHLKILNFHRSF